MRLTLLQVLVPEEKRNTGGLIVNFGQLLGFLIGEKVINCQIKSFNIIFYIVFLYPESHKILKSEIRSEYSHKTLK